MEAMYIPTPQKAREEVRKTGGAKVCKIRAYVGYRDRSIHRPRVDACDDVCGRKRGESCVVKLIAE